MDVDGSPDKETVARVNGRAPPPEREGRVPGGELNAALARAVVQHYAEQLGRGPTKAQAFHRDNVVVVVLGDVMTKAERSLAADGRGDVVLRTRRAFQEMMRRDLRSTAERLTGCRVQASMSAHDVDSDLAAELFILDRAVAETPDAHRGRSATPISAADA